MRELTVFDKVSIPVDYASTQTYAILAKRDGGKTYTTLKLEEQMCDAGLFFVVLDPVGKHWALRAGKNGKAGGGKSDVWVLGGTHGDVALDPDSGALIADVVVDHPGRYVLDVSTFETDAEQDRFALAFGQRLFRRKAKDPGFPLLVILEEAEAFIPERPRPGQQKMLGAYGRIMRQGRNHGLGMLMVAQRAQALNKGVLSQAEVLIVKQMAHKRDRDAVDDWIKANGTPAEREEMMASLASLKQTEAYVWSPSWLRIFTRAKVLARETFDSSASVKSGERMTSIELKPLDVQALGAKISEISKRAAEDDPKKLRKQIAELEAQIKRAPAAEPEVREVPVLPDGHAKSLEEIHATVDRVVANLLEARARLQFLAEDAAKVPSAMAQELAVEVRREAPIPPKRTRSEPQMASGNGSLPKAAAELAEALASFPAGISRDRLALLTGRKPRGGSWNTAMKMLLELEYASDEGYLLLPTDKAREEFPGARALSGQDLIDLWKEKLGPAPTDIFNVLVSIYPREFTHEEIGQHTGRAPRGGSWNTAIKQLVTSGLVISETRGRLKANPDLMEG